MGWKMFEANHKDYNVNLWAYRTFDCNSDMPNDYIGLTWKDTKGVWQHRVWLCTTDPGIQGLLNPPKKEGTAIIKHSEFYKAAFAIGIHAAANSNYAHEALRQVRDMKYWRDNNKDKVRDYSGKVLTGLFNTNIHSTPRSWVFSPKIRFNSVGCFWVPDNKAFHDEFMDICRKARSNWGNSFSLAFFYEGDLS